MSVEVKRVRCDLCGREDEGLEFTKRLLIFKTRFKVCEGCVSRLFRKFKKSE